MFVISTINIPNRNRYATKLHQKNSAARSVRKYSRYFDDANFWRGPEKQQQGKEPAPDEYEMYNLTLDPLETSNLAHPSQQTPETQKRQQELQTWLAGQNAKKRLTPRNETDANSSTGGGEPDAQP